MKQPEALRLADALDSSDQDLLETEVALRAASELRRLHEANQAMSDTSSQIIADNMRLHEANQAMLEALKTLEELGAFEDGMFGDHGGIPQAQAKARAAIAKGEQQ